MSEWVYDKGSLSYNTRSKGGIKVLLLGLVRWWWTIIRKPSGAGDRQPVRDMKLESVYSSGSVTSLCCLVVPAASAARSERTNERLLVLTGVCSNLFVHDGKSGEMLHCRKHVLPHGLRIHGIEWMCVDEEKRKLLVVVHGGRCVNVLVVDVIGRGEGVQLCNEMPVKGIQKWVMSTKLVAMRVAGNMTSCACGGFLLCIGTIDNMLHTYHVSERNSVEMLSSVGGYQRSLLYSMDLCASVDEASDTRIQCSFIVAAGTILWKIEVWKAIMSFSVGAGGLIEMEEMRSVPVYLLEGHQGSIHCVRWSPNAELLASGSDDRTVKVWKIDKAFDTTLPGCAASSSKQVLPCPDLYGSKSRIWELQFSSDGAKIFSGSEDGSWTAWELSSKKCLAKVKV